MLIWHVDNIMLMWYVKWYVTTQEEKKIIILHWKLSWQLFRVNTIDSLESNRLLDWNNLQRSICNHL